MAHRVGFIRSNMQNIRNRRGATAVHVLVGAMLFGAMLDAIPAAASAPIPNGRTPWLDGSLDHAISQAKAEKKRLFIKFEASWCGPCQRLGKLLDTAEGRAVLGGALAVRVDFDLDANRKHIEKFVVLGLPTVAVLDPDGTQVSRIEGFDSKETWLAEAKAAKTALDPLPSLHKQHRDAPNDAGAAMRYGKALLVRGSEVLGLKLLERTLWLTHSAPAGSGPPANNRALDNVAAETLFVLGRYHHRVRRDPKTAQHLWRELAVRFPTSDFVGGAWWWYARSQHELGRTDVGLLALKARLAAHPRSLSAIGQWVSFAAKHKLAAEVPALKAALAQGAVGRSKEEQQRFASWIGKVASILAPKDPTNGQAAPERSN